MALLSSQRIAEFLGKERIPWESISGVLHITLLYDDASNAHLKNIKIQSPTAPRNLFDFLLLNTTRARSSIVITSGATLRCEGGNEIKLCKPFDKDLQSWRRDNLGINGGTSFVMTKSGDLSPSWPIFSTPDSLFSPVIFARENAVSGIQDRFTSSKVPILPLSKFDECIIDEEFDSFLNALKKMLAAQGQPTTWLPRASSKLIPHVISIECGPTMTGPLYETIDGKIRKDCPVDWLLLTRFSGDISSDALGENVIQKNTINHLFDLVISSSPSFTFSGNQCGGASAIRSEPALNEWTFELWKRRRL
jgi:hypothetical protein